MKGNLANNMDFLAGLLMITLGAAAFYMALDYPFGSTLRMGPGYFPRVLAGILISFGVFVLIRGLATGTPVKGRWGIRALVMLCMSLVAFGWTMEHFGLVPSLVVMFFLSAAAGTEFKATEVAILTVVMSIFAWAVFIWGIGLPYPLFGGY
jgi:hypothetical protein